MPRRLVLTLIALGLTMALTAAPVAAGTLDQQQTTANNIPPVAGGVKQAQVFTAGLTGQLDQVDVLVSRNDVDGGPGTDLTVEIWTVTAGVPDSPVPGASATVLQTDVPASTQTWVAVPISAPSVAGTQYAIVLSAPAANLGGCPNDCWVWWAFDGDPYAGGAAYATNGPPTWILKQQDQAFRTYVAAPAPSVAASLADAATAPPTAGSPLATLGFAVLLLASLATLAFANVRRR
jgi:hypothetical protein